MGRTQMEYRQMTPGQMREAIGVVIDAIPGWLPFSTARSISSGELRARQDRLWWDILSDFTFNFEVAPPPSLQEAFDAAGAPDGADSLVAYGSGSWNRRKEVLEETTQHEGGSSSKPVAITIRTYPISEEGEGKALLAHDGYRPATLLESVSYVTVRRGDLLSARMPVISCIQNPPIFAPEGCFMCFFDPDLNFRGPVTMDAFNTTRVFGSKDFIHVLAVKL